LYDHGLRAPAKVISNGIDLKKFTPGERSEQVLQRLNLPLDRQIVLHVNRLYNEKRIDVLLDAAAKMKSNAHIALAGAGPLEADLREQAERLNLGDRVSFLGFVRDADLLALRRSSDVFVIPSEAELQSLSTMEAGACGLPVVAANSYALPELVHHGENGYLFQPGNSDELASYIDKLLADPALRTQMGQKSLEVIAKHERSKILDQWESLYRRLSIEFVEAKERKLQLLRARKFPGYIPPTPRRPRIVRTGELVLDPFTPIDEEMQE